MLQQLEDFLHSLRPELWLVYHVNMKAIQCGALMGVASYILNVPLINNKLNSVLVKSKDENDKYSQLRQHLLQSFLVAISMAIGVSIYNLIKLSDDILEDRVYRIINSNSQKQIDYSCIIGGFVGFGYSIKEIMSREIALEDDDTYNYKMMLQDSISNGLIGVSAGVVFHFVRTRRIVAPSMIWRYTTQCWK